MDNRLVESVRHKHFHWHFELLHSVSVLIIQSVKTVEQHSIFYVHRTVNARQTLQHPLAAIGLEKPELLGGPTFRRAALALYAMDCELAGLYFRHPSLLTTVVDQLEERPTILQQPSGRHQQRTMMQ